MKKQLEKIVIDEIKAAFFIENGEVETNVLAYKKINKCNNTVRICDFHVSMTRVRFILENGFSPDYRVNLENERDLPKRIYKIAGVRGDTYCFRMQRGGNYYISPNFKNVEDAVEYSKNLLKRLETGKNRG